MRRCRAAIFRATVVAIVVAACLNVGHALRERAASDRFARELADSKPADAESIAHAMLVGVWEDDYQGKRTMTLNADGSGVMVVELSGWRAAMSAPRLTFRMKWAVADGHLKKQTIGGEPKAQVDMILKMMGDHVDERILELTRDRLLLLDQDGKTKYDWRRVKEK